uniref:DJ-1/PfpI domain-containing protein n=1 Tax=Megaselia scalaris TaxID=36166 RepID=T1GAG1_MEGSC
MSKKACIIIVVGVEEMEVLTLLNILRRAGLEVIVAGLWGDISVKCKNKLVILPDKSLESIKDIDFDIIILPGGIPATKAMQDSELLAEVLRKQEKKKRYIATMGTSTIVLEHHAIMKGKNVTSDPKYKTIMCRGGYNYNEKSNVVKDGNLITSAGLGTTMEFALRIACIFTEPGNTKFSTPYLESNEQDIITPGGTHLEEYPPASSALGTFNEKDTSNVT